MNDRVLQAFEDKLLTHPTPELADAYIRLRSAMGKDGDYDAVLKRLEALEKRVTFVEGIAGTKRMSLSSTGVRLG